MAISHEVSERSSWLTRVLTTDFCPWANRFFYWLKEPIGWFVLAAIVAGLVGRYLSPIGWTLAASLLGIIVVGIAWPAIAVYLTACGLRPAVDALYEGENCKMTFSVTNRLPIPVWGLAIEGYLDLEGRDPFPTVALASVPSLSTADYSVTVTPTLRGHYPVQQPKVACSFPFGIWTARRPLQQMQPLTVWPKIYPVQGVCPITGKQPADAGDGKQGGRIGDFVGVRAYRRGDSARQIHWIASARTDALVVTERGGPQTEEIQFWLDTANAAGDCEAVARQVRVAASLLVKLHASATPLRIRIGALMIRPNAGPKGRRQILDALAAVPANGESLNNVTVSCRKPHLEVRTTGDGSVVVKVQDTSLVSHRGKSLRPVVFRLGDDLESSLRTFWKEVYGVEHAA